MDEYYLVVTQKCGTNLNEKGVIEMKAINLESRKMANWAIVAMPKK